jgi:hypothetical protein
VVGSDRVVKRTKPKSLALLLQPVIVVVSIS